MKRSIPAFVSGLIINICIGLACTLLFVLFSVIIGLAIGFGGATTPLTDFVHAFSGVCIATSVIGIAGAIVCLRNKKVGGIIMSVSALADVVLAVSIIISNFIYATAESPVKAGSVIVLIIAALASVVPPVLAFISKKEYIEQPITDKF